MKPGLPSTTATWVSFLRGLASLEENRLTDDPIALALLPPPYAALLRAAERSDVARVVVRGVTDAVSAGHARHVALRTRAIDDAVAAGVESGARQLVMIGAGLDARAFRMPGLEGVTAFELDHPDTQAYKRARVSGLVAKARTLRFVPIDFEKDALAEALAAAGHDARVPSVFVWEGVTLYLTREASAATLAAIAECAAPASTLALTYFEPRGASLGARFVRGLVSAVGEPQRTTYVPRDMQRMVEDAGFHVVGDERETDLAARYAARTDGAQQGSGVPSHVLTAVRRA